MGRTVERLDPAVRDKLVNRLIKLEQNVEGITASILIEASGYPIAAALRSDVGQDKLSAASAALFSIAERISRDLKMGNVEINIVQSEGGYVVVMEVRPEARLVVQASKDSKIGVVLLETKKAAQDLEKILLEARSKEGDVEKSAYVPPSSLDEPSPSFPH